MPRIAENELMLLRKRLNRPVCISQKDIRELLKREPNLTFEQRRLQIEAMENRAFALANERQEKLRKNAKRWLKRNPIVVGKAADHSLPPLKPKSSRI